MKILCDVCGADEAAVFCSADEAALCSACDRRVHHANKFTRKHACFSLLSQTHPLCDVCQERRAFVFCKEDRAILCNECDFPIHAANSLTMKHSRFILTGARLSAASVTSLPNPESSLPGKTASAQLSPIADCSSSSSISEYLIKTLPGYRVEDFLVDSGYATGDVFCQGADSLPFEEADLDICNFGASAADWSFCVPDASLHIHPAASVQSAVAAVPGNAIKELWSKETSRAHHLVAAPAGAAAPATRRGTEQRVSGEVFAVPELPGVLAGSNKRPGRPSAWYL